MRKILSILLCLLITLSIVSCEKETSTQQNSDDKKDINSTEESSADEKSPYAFISQQERLSWKDKIVTVISNNDLYDDYEVLEHNFLGMALMDLNLDNTPEVIAAYAGGSMGNVCIVAYDLETSERLCVLGDTPHYKDWDNIYLCVHRDNEGNYLIVNEGALRSGLEWYTITSSLNNQFKYDTLFEEVQFSDDNIRYYCKGNEVEKTEFEKQKDQFKNDYKEIKETQINIVYWNTIESKTKSDAIIEMADALVNSDQQFIRFDITPSTADKTEEQTLADCKKAYLGFLKDKKDSYRLFALVFVDDDDIPELYLSGVSEAEGDMICSFKNDIVIYEYLSRTGGGKYIERSGDIINQNGHMRLYYDNVYKLNENGFSKTLDARYTERYEHIGNDEYNTYREYFIDNTPVSEAEYNHAVNSAFDISKAVRLDKNAVSYNAILQQLQNGNYDGKQNLHIVSSIQVTIHKKSNS